MLQYECGCVGVGSVDPDYVIMVNGCGKHKYGLGLQFVDIPIREGWKFKIMDKGEEESFMSIATSSFRSLHNRAERFDKIRSALK